MECLIYNLRVEEMDQDVKQEYCEGGLGCKDNEAYGLCFLKYIA